MYDRRSGRGGTNTVGSGFGGNLGPWAKGLRIGNGTIPVHIRE